MMDYTVWNQMQPNQPLNPNPVTDPYAQNPQPTQNYYLSQSQNHNPNPSIDPQNPLGVHYVSTLVEPSGSDPYQSAGTYTLGHGYTYQIADGTSVVVSTDAVAADPFAAINYAASVIMPPNGIQSLVAATHPRKSSYWTKGPKKTKVIQSVWCEICNILCNTKEVLEQHRLGKKHMKNLEKLMGGSASAPSAAKPHSLVPASGSSTALVTSNNPIIGPQEDPNKKNSAAGQNAWKKPGNTPEDLETKRRKILSGGAAAAAVRTCVLCNVVCNSETVFYYHLAGQKHAAMVKKHASSIVAAAGT